MVPAYFVRLETLPLTANGKINRQILPDPAETGVASAVAFVAPKTEVELGLASIWSQTLNVERIGIHDNFFNLGGASIPAVQAVAKISDRYGINFPVKSFFEQPTIAGQSALVEELLVSQLEALSDEEVERLLAEMEE
jgi:acyl carrier protein